MRFVFIPFWLQRTALAVALLLALSLTSAAFGQRGDFFDGCFQKPSYVAYRAAEKIDVDGRIDDAAWSAAPWTSTFVEMAGAGPPPSDLATRVKVIWDDEFLYVAARLDEHHVWATMTERDSRIYLDHAFEVFIDPDGDTHNYYEFEVNALGTIWDLMLIRPYRDGGPAISAWNIEGLEMGVEVDGTVNDPSDTDEGWSVELAFPWSVLTEAAPQRQRPEDGAQWRMNFSRSHWPLDVSDGAYSKIPDTPAAWSVWSPQGVIDIHRPECWGYVQFAEAPAGSGEVAFVEAANEGVKEALQRLYHEQHDHFLVHGRYADDAAALGAGEIRIEGVAFDPHVETTASGFEITASGSGQSTVHIRQDGRVWVTAE